MTLRQWRIPLILIVLALGGWLTYAIIHAGDDIPGPTAQPETKLDAGRAEGRRLKFKAWTLDYDKVSTSPDGSIATLDGVHDGRFYKDGKPTMTMKAQHVVVNLNTNDFFESGPVDVTDIATPHHRHFVSDAATYAGASQILTLTNLSTIKSDGVTVRVASATVNFKTGDIQLGRMVGVH